jgi:hypothetical protein
VGLDANGLPLPAADRGRWSMKESLMLITVGQSALRTI